MMNQDQIISLFSDHQAIIQNTHVVYTSGRHGDTYVNKDALYPHTDLISMLCEVMARAYVAADVAAVVGPTIGGVVLSQWVAHHLSRLTGKSVLALFSEEGPNKTRLLKRGYDHHVRGKNILLVEDVLTTGGSIREVVDIVRKEGGNPIGIAALVNRGGVSAENVGGVDIRALVTLELTTYSAEECPLCRSGVPINTSVGKGQTLK